MKTDNRELLNYAWIAAFGITCGILALFGLVMLIAFFTDAYPFNH
jgi:hypothetical protein